MSEPHSKITFRYKGRIIFTTEFNHVVSMSDFTGTIETIGQIEEEK